MEIITITAISVIITVYVLYPLFLDYGTADKLTGTRSSSGDHGRILDLESQKESIYSELRDIEFDYNLGKITEEDYTQLTEKYKRRAAAVIMEIEKLKKT